ncbi:hypothetical protein Barb7_02005 [Bacteroidales bacterium Barb7]|nr:hypothetical protein Barb4_02854 [Bacteroidales bacterium Barb4]OAV74498.1 hypothetical protein Barb7_02005 [Bacteroidales bacterium Barb7]
MKNRIERDSEKKTAAETKKKVSARDRIKPRGMVGFMKGKIHYDKDADIFNLEL